MVHNGILHLICHKLGVTELIREHDGINGKTLGIIQVLFPFDGLHAFIDFIGIVGLKMFNGFQDADGSAQAEVCLIHQSLVASKGYHTVTDLNVTGSQLSKFFCQYFFQSVEGFGNQLEFFLHKGMIIT